MQELLAQEGIYLVKGPMCRFDKELSDHENGGVGFCLKQTGWLTNCKALAEALEGECSNITGERAWHRHVHIIGHGLGKLAQVYPPKLLREILLGLKEEMKKQDATIKFACLVFAICSRRY